MKTTDKKDLQTKSTKELQKMLDETSKTLKQLKFDHVQNKIKNTRSIFTTRKQIAVMQTILHAKLTTKEENK